MSLFENDFGNYHSRTNNANYTVSAKISSTSLNRVNEELNMENLLLPKNEEKNDLGLDSFKKTKKTDIASEKPKEKAAKSNDSGKYNIKAKIGGNLVNFEIQETLDENGNTVLAGKSTDGKTTYNQIIFKNGKTVTTMSKIKPDGTIQNIGNGDDLFGTGTYEIDSHVDPTNNVIIESNQKIYDENGALTLETNLHIDENGQSISTFKNYFEGELVAESSSYTDGNGIVHINGENLGGAFENTSFSSNGTMVTINKNGTMTENGFVHDKKEQDKIMVTNLNGGSSVTTSDEIKSLLDMKPENNIGISTVVEDFKYDFSDNPNFTDDSFIGTIGEQSEILNDGTVRTESLERTSTGDIIKSYEIVNQETGELIDGYKEIVSNDGTTIKGYTIPDENGIVHTRIDTYNRDGSLAESSYGYRINGESGTVAMVKGNYDEEGFFTPGGEKTITVNGIEISSDTLAQIKNHL